MTGDGRGIGKVLSRALAERGASVGILGTTGGPVKALADELNGEGSTAVGIACDVADEGQVKAAVDGIAERFGGIDILINNAALHSSEYNKGFTTLGLEKTRRLFDVNVIGLSICATACRPHMQARGGGVILNISSIGGYRSDTAYGVSKLAARGATICLANELADDNIRVNGVAPGLIATDQIINDYPAEFLENHVQANQKVHRLGQIDDIVQAMLYFCSNRASFVTGETLKVTGGQQLFI